jgi:lipopolysaccharide export system permease protein
VKIIHKYVLREHAGPLVFALSALTSLMLLNYVAKQLGNLVGKGLDWTVILEFFVLSLPFTVAMTLPMAVLVAVLYAFSRLAAENEITALKANGVSMTRLLVPVVVGGAMLSIAMIAFNDQVLPRTNHRLRTLQGDIARKKPTFAIKEQIINEVAPNSYFLRTNHLDRETNGMREVTIYDLSDPMRRRTIYADSGTMAFNEDGTDLQLTLFSGFMQEVPKDTPTQLQRLYFTVDLIRVPGVANAFQRDSTDTYKSDREMSVCELQGEVARYERDYIRSFDDYQRASDMMKKDPTGSIVVNPTYPFNAPGARTERSRVRSLGRTYCDVLARVQRAAAQGMASASAGLGDMARRAAPRAAFAATSPSPPVQQDTLRAKRDSAQRDSVRRDSVRHDSVRRDSVRRDSLRRDSLRRDSLRRDSVAAPVTPAQEPPRPMIVPAPISADSARKLEEWLRRGGDRAAPIPSTVTGDTTRRDSLAMVDSAGLVPNVAPSLPPGAILPPSAGGGGIPQPASVVMETARSQMLSARSQMNQFAVEIQKKFAISMACVIFVLLGAPIALRFPRGGVGLVIGVSLGVFGLYYVGLIAGEALADRAILTPFWAMWSANLLFTAVSLVLLARMGRETATARGGDLSELVEAFKEMLARPFRRRGTA